MAKVNFTKQDIRRHLDKGAARIEQQIIMRLQYIGEECVREARESGNYIDQTGALRSSVGYVVTKNGRVVDENFQQKGNASEGVAAGKKFAREKAASFPNGYALIVVAAMPYADKLESMGYNVVSSAESYAKASTPRLLQELKRSIGTIK